MKRQPLEHLYPPCAVDETLSRVTFASSVFLFSNLFLQIHGSVGRESDPLHSYK